MKKKFVFLDRDGTLIEEVNFLSTVEETRVFPFTAEALVLLRDAGFMFAMTTNQSGIARGYFTEQAVIDIYDEIQRQLSPHDVQFDSLQFCPHLPDSGSRLRKPDIGMIEDAIDGYEVDLSECWVIGDKKLDIEMGFNAGTKTALVETGYGKSHSAEMDRKPDIVAENLLEVAKKIVND